MPQDPNNPGTSSPSPLAKVRRHPFLAALGVLLLAIVVVLLLWDWNWFKGPLERMVKAQTGRELRIGGDLDVDLGRVSTVTADRITFSNAEWSRVPRMASADRVEVDIETWPLLLKREFRIPALRLRKPDLRLEKGPGDVGNWVWERRGDGLQFRRLWVDDGRFQYLDAPRKTDIKIKVASRTAASPGAAAPIAVDGGGRWQGNPLTVQGRAESPLALTTEDAPYRIDLTVQAGPTRAHARGTLLDPLQLRDFDLQLALSGQDLEDLYPLIGIATPSTPPYKLDGRLTREGATWKYDRFTGVVGDSDLAGSASVTTGGKRPFLRADLVSKRLDFDDLAGFIGGAPQAGKSETTNAAQAALAAREAASPRVLPDTPYALDKLRAMDADVRLRATRINAPSLPLDDMDAHLLLQDGVARLDPLNFGVAGGDIRSTIRMDARESPIQTSARIDARGLDIAKLLPDSELMRDAIGKLGGHLDIKGRGNSIAGMLGTSSGDIALGIGRGQISNLLLEFAGIDVAEALRFLLTEDRKVPIRCAFGDFAVKDGVMQARSLAFDTTDTIIVGTGTVSLRDETLDLRLRPRPKDRSLLTLRSPLLMGGTFKDPSFRPDLARVGLRGAIALALGTIAPPAALLATIDLGGGEDSSCGGRYAK